MVYILATVIPLRCNKLFAHSSQGWPCSLGFGDTNCARYIVQAQVLPIQCVDVTIPFLICPSSEVGEICIRSWHPLSRCLQWFCLQSPVTVAPLRCNTLVQAQVLYFMEWCLLNFGAYLPTGKYQCDCVLQRSGVRVARLYTVKDNTRERKLSTETNQCHCGVSPLVMFLHTCLLWCIHVSSVHISRMSRYIIVGHVKLCLLCSNLFLASV